MTNKKKAKFFCENCGSEVPDNAKFCKKCGKFFISVRCPSCGKTGNSKDFKKGCPACGYAQKNMISTFSKTQNNSIALQHIFSQASGSLKNKKNTKDSSLPLWIYLFTFGMLLIVMIGLYTCIIKTV